MAAAAARAAAARAARADCRLSLAKIGLAMGTAPNQIETITARGRLVEAERQVSGGAAAAESAYADLAELLLAEAGRLTHIAAGADFSPPPYPPAKGREIELTLSQTREMRFRFGSGERNL